MTDTRSNRPPIVAMGDRPLQDVSGVLGSRIFAWIADIIVLAILGSLIGTPWLPDLTDHELLIEEVSEPLYNVDRLLFTMANATQLRGIAGVRLGAVTDVQENTPRWGETLDVMIRRWCADMGVPFLGPAEIGHTQTNHVVPFGMA